MGFWTRVRLPSIPFTLFGNMWEENPLGSDSRLFHYDAENFVSYIRGLYGRKTVHC